MMTASQVKSMLTKMPVLHVQRVRLVRSQVLARLPANHVRLVRRLVIHHSARSVQLASILQQVLRTAQVAMLGTMTMIPTHPLHVSTAMSGSFLLRRL